MTVSPDRLWHTSLNPDIGSASPILCTTLHPATHTNNGIASPRDTLANIKAVRRQIAVPALTSHRSLGDVYSAIAVAASTCWRCWAAPIMCVCIGLAPRRYTEAVPRLNERAFGEAGALSSLSLLTRKGFRSRILAWSTQVRILKYKRNFFFLEGISAAPQLRGPPETERKYLE